ncbi:uncharacterized protein LOC129869881 [Solanum dulcamara]|uniref:uncharacterized protein LOC129869881 n=1 Tax=Solanum dulcamara TaxID=45834 RepID=UPI002486192F|nr:uncharacterized protein LOC129869881 [Solanum dulcamara]
MNQSQPDCGLYTIHCDVTPNPTIHLGENAYSVLQKRSFDRFRVLDHRLHDLLAKNSCQSFDRSISFPSSPSISFRIYKPHLALFRCNDSLDIDASMNDHYFRDYQNYTKCSGFNIYYTIPNSEREGSSDSPEGDIPDNCSLIQLPWRSSSNAQNSSSLFDLITANFTIQWTLSDDCSNCYSQGGGRCLTDNNNKFLCSTYPPKPKESRNVL